MGKKWIGSKPTHCDVCKRELNGTFADARTPGGRWAILCDRCVRTLGTRFGLGLGQLYNLSTGEKLNG